MPILKRISDTFWTYVSPKKPAPAPVQEETKSESVKEPASPVSRDSLHDHVRRSHSMSPDDRVAAWKLGSSSETAEVPTPGSKRKRARAPSTGKRSKKTKQKAQDREDTPEDEEHLEGDTLVEDDNKAANSLSLHSHSANSPANSTYDTFKKEDDNKAANSLSLHSHSANSPANSTYDTFKKENDNKAANSLSFHSHSANSPANSTYDTFKKEDSADDTLVALPADEYALTGSSSRKFDLSSEAEARGVSTPELEEQGWSDEHISLAQHLSLRGYEPLFPTTWKFDFRNLPDGLFEEDPKDDGFICSVSRQDFRATKALEHLFDVGPHMRDRVLTKTRRTAEYELECRVREYMKWALKDAVLDKRTALPLLAIETAAVTVPAEVMKANLTAKLEHLASRWSKALTVQDSVELSSSADASAVYTHRLPTLYGIMASHLALSLAAYRPEKPERGPIVLGTFSFKDKDYDVWNALALAITVVHCRDVQVAFADETSLGDMSGVPKEEVDDPDA